MESEGMVHALETIRSLLKPGGALIDIHPTTKRPEIFARTKAGTRFIGTLNETDEGIEYAQAEAALEQAVRTGKFVQVFEDQFTFSNHADTIQSLEKYLAENWKDAVLTQAVFEKALALQNAPAGVEDIILTESVHIARLRALGQG